MPRSQKPGSAMPAEAIGQTIGGPSGRLSTSLEMEDPSSDNLKHRLHEWAASGARNDDDDDQGSEYELLMDPNLPEEYETRRKGSEDSGDEAALIKDDEEEEENSPYPEVRAAVRNYDEDLPCNTVRAWTIGMLLVVLGASMNTLFSLRQPSIGVGPLIAQIIAWPMGHGWARFVPDREFTTFGVRWTLNPGPFNIKEHAIIVVMASVSFSVAYATDIILAQLVFYKQNFGIMFQLLLTISTQSVGYGIAGMLRKFLVYPASMIWPENLVGVTLMNAMYERNDAPDPTIIGGTMHRYKWFTIVTGCAFAYYFIPGFLAQFLSIFAVATWLAPQNPVVNQLFGGQTGLSLLPITFDWTQIAGYVGSPLIPPWHAIANTLIGVGTFFIVLSSFLHYGGVWYAEYLPMSDSSTYDNTGAPYNTTRILTPEFTLDEEEYKNYSPLFISTTFAMSYGLSFAAISSLVVYTYLHNGKQIWQQWRNSTKEKPDIHMKLMNKYKEAPTWWYMSLFAAMLLIGFYTVLGFPTNLSWWAFLLAIAISFGFALPIGIIQAVTNTQIGLNVLTEFIYGYLQPGRPLALMIFKTYGYITMAQSLRFVSDLKFGHYMKIPPRTMFLTQVVATTFSCFIQIVVLNLALNNIEDVCEPHQVDHFTCPGGRVFFAASIIWGLLGPARMFSPGQVYSGLFTFFIVGAITPIVIYLAAKRWPRSPVRYLMAPLIFGGAGAIPPATPLNYLSWGVVGFVFQFWIKKRHFRWWTRLNFLTSSALDLGLALATLFIFFAFTLHGVEPPSWWGNNVVSTTMDVQGTAIQAHVAKGERFGPESW
ncbi:OPT oligopeptide transporter protein-domain-containing protein [Fusarium solani]|uniref:OPT oligopeptide transporter protein-domain-containing protein n=1 Tax=Fusarium solani TaxID=169388 RepID=A0A9P9L1A3_FUSSL|nr:OPT oligopeptide transporter protein-domain-containing protein [Fusarium solani]KAH7272790.1 OPT oligopeptide transporter protein-domain-containing protein [Fusarium solani]